MIAPAVASHSTAESARHDDWWISLKHGGLLIAPSKLSEFFVPQQLAPLSRYVEDQLRREVTRLQDGDDGQIGSFLDTVLEDVLGLSKDFWQKGTSVGRNWAQQAITREQIKPRRVWQDDRGAVLPVFVTDGQKEKVARLGIGRGRRAVSRVVEWLRKADQKVALLTNGIQWRLIHAGADYDAWCEWDINLWFEEGKPSAQVTALRLLLGEAAVRPEGADVPSALIAAIQTSRQGQAELSDVLGERVRKAVELLIRESSEALDELLMRPEGAVENKAIYIAASRIVMRCVVILFAEARDLLPRENPIYHSSYGIQGLREQLDRMSGGRAAERLRDSYGAWPRLLSLFRLVYEGSAHEALPVPSYGGGLFTPGEMTAKDSVIRALAALENPDYAPSDAVIYRMLELLCRSRVKVRQGRRSTWVEAPVDFSDLSSEYIGILYEGLLDFELRRATAGDPMVFLNLGDQPVLPLTRLEGMDDKALASLVDKLKEKAKPSVGEDEGDEDESEEEVTDEAPSGEATDSGADDEDNTDEDDTDRDEQDDVVQDLRERAYAWAVRAVKAGKLVNKPRSKKADKLAAYEQQVSKMADRLIARIILPGGWFLVRWGGTRKGSGTFYTRPQLAVPTVQRTLLPLAYTAPLKQSGQIEIGETESSQRDEMAPMAEWSPKLPGKILALKVCDPACGSASFLIASLRFLVDALWSSLFEHEWLIERGDEIEVGLLEEKQPDWFVECVRNFPLTVEQAEAYCKPRLKRYVVERCIYGVDINPLAVELGRLALWVETMDRALPFGFLDHKVKCGNALVGCWFDRFQDYPAMAWEREGGDANHNRFVSHFREYTATRGKQKGEFLQSGDVWTQAIKDAKSSMKSELVSLIKAVDPQWKHQTDMFETEFDLPKLPEEIHQDAFNVFEEMHRLALVDTQTQARRYRERIEESEDLRQLRRAFDTWCAVWFWPGEEIDNAPTPGRFFALPEETAETVDRLVREHQFFHWEIAFPDVFIGENAGFDGVVGNPPWEIQKPNSKEFFSNVDPLYRTYGKQEALKKQTEYFEDSPRTEREWLAYNAKLKALSNWTKYVGYPFGVNEAGEFHFSLVRGKKNEILHQDWLAQQMGRSGFADPVHPFVHQGSADINTYKMFTELGHALLREGGRFSLIVPSGLYTDKGSGSLRKLFLNHCEWTRLYALQNERFVFSNIHHSFKMVVFSVNKGGCTKSIATRFRLGPGDSPEAQELMNDIPDNTGYLSVPAEQIKRFSPNTGALLEIRTERDLQILEKMYSNGVLLGDDGPQGWGIQYATEFHMTSDSKLFPPRPKWEAKGYRPDEYGHWLKGHWRDAADFGLSATSGTSLNDPARSVLKRPEGVILSADGAEAIHVDEVEDVALPLYQGVMIHQFDFSRKGWVSGTGLRAIWREIAFEEKEIEPQFLIGLKDYALESKGHRGLRVSFRDIARSTDERTFISALLPDTPCGNKVPILNATSTNHKDLDLCSLVNSFTFDFSLRSRLGGTSLNYFIISELPLAKNVDQSLERITAQLNFVNSKFSSEWIGLRPRFANELVWRSLWAITSHERLRLRCILDAIVAHLYGLNLDDFSWILQDCDHPTAKVCDNTFARTLEPKGFWRVDKEKDPELRHTVLSLVAFHDLQSLGLDNFLALNDGEGWMLPETLRLADYGLGHDDRAKVPQPVATRLGDRFLPWQIQGTPEESWAECERHAENLKRLLGNREPEEESEQATKSAGSVKKDNTVQPATQQLGLFDTR